MSPELQSSSVWRAVEDARDKGETDWTLIRWHVDATVDFCSVVVVSWSWRKSSCWSPTV